MKKIVSTFIALSLFAAMAVTASAEPNTADNVNDNETEVTSPGHKGTGGYDGSSNYQTEGASYGEATVTHDGTSWVSVNDDDNDGGTDDTDGTDIYVWARVTNDGAALYKIDISWGAMKFEFSGGGSTWDVDLHQYVGSDTGDKEWITAGFLDDSNNKIEIVNHSNSGVTATFAYAMDVVGGNTMFNDGWYYKADAVVGSFYPDNSSSISGSMVLAGVLDGNGARTTALDTYTLSNQIWNNNTNALETKKNAIALPTAEAEYGGDDQITAGARRETINFAFSGTPDEGRGSVLNTFKKVGVITVTVEPNLDPDLNVIAQTP